ncbi:MAG: TlpA family protein disulfide reductase, partial [Pseudomonadota bacterium]
MFNRRNLIQSLAALAAPGVAARAWARTSNSPLPQVGSSLPLPAVSLLDGRVWTPAAVGGKTLVVYWWASWCPFCAVQSPH